jgi:bifunctional non-homologous end joining protein LigD
MHAARKLHFDFRLEWEGVLKSWAVPRGPSLDPQDKRLAVEVEDHPLDYGSFEGLIPQGEYGGGTVMLWDRGTWQPVGDVDQSLKRGKLDFILEGERLQGRFHLQRLKDEGGKHHWLLIKGKDEYARPGDGDAALRQATSVKTGRTMNEIATQVDGDTWHSGKTGKKASPRANGTEKTEGNNALDDSDALAAPSRALPAFIPPALAVRAAAPPRGAHWLHEIKYDGYRIGARIERKRRGKAKVTLLSRSGLDWTHRFKGIAAALAGAAHGDLYLDGEIVALNAEGVADFGALQEALSNDDQGAMAFFMFDLLYCDGQDLRPLPLAERKKRLAELMAGHWNDRLRYTDHFKTRPEDLFRAACSLNLEGIVSKKDDAPYRSGRRPQWLKVKCLDREEYVIGGYTPSKAGKGIGSILVGHYREGVLVFDGRAGTGFSQKLALALKKKLERHAIPTSPFAAMRPIDRRRAKWVQPLYVVEIKHMGRSRDGLLRAAAFLGLRDDKTPEDVVGEQIVPRPEKVAFAGVPISHPQRVLDPTTGLTKENLAAYYEAAAPHALWELTRRPLSLVRCPDGINGQKFFQRHPHAIIQVRPLRDPGTGEELIAIDDLRGLETLVQFGIIEIHPWNCRVDDLEKADRMIFDLDPDPTVAFSEVVRAAHELRERLDDLGLRSVAKLTGGKGAHVTVPLKPRLPWGRLKEIAKALAFAMAKDSPTRYVAVMSKARRHGKIFIDYLRNDHFSTAIGIYAARARAGLPVAMPIDWAQLTEKISPASFTIAGPVQPLPEEWRDLDKIRQGFTARALKTLGMK